MSQEYINTHFQPWMQRVNDIVINTTGHSIYDLPDQFYADNFEAGSSPEYMANIVISDFNGYADFIVNMSQDLSCYNDSNNSYLP